MNLLKKWLSIIITVTMIFSMVPVTAFAEEENSIPIEAVKEEENSEVLEETEVEEIETEKTEENISDTESDSETEENFEQEVSKEEPSNQDTSQIEDTTKEELKEEFPEEVVAEETTVIYNLLNTEITVGNDEEKALESPYLYKLFDGNGEYTIELEDNAFFPYEVQFKYNGDTTVQWFDTPESTVEIGGHVFKVHSEVTRDDMLRQFGVYVGGEYVPAYPEPKEFTNNLGISPMSLLPLEETKLNLDLTGYFPLLLDSVELSAIAGLDIKPQDKVFVRQKINMRDEEKEFRLLGDNEGLNVSLIEKYMYNDEVEENFIDVNRDAFRFELIVGSGKQLDLNNHRYEIDINMTSLEDSIEYFLYEQLSTERNELSYSSEYTKN
ncbi:MAG TPA: hypothetical protein IAD10_01005, partial [Candidatus Fimicola cottocaccae]|nr:hypothetical protein [Candidatus Fimicola cottocaccae]